MIFEICVERRLTELGEVDAVLQRLYAWITAESPEYRENQRRYYQKGEYQEPGELEDVRDRYELQVFKKSLLPSDPIEMHHARCDAMTRKL